MKQQIMKKNMRSKNGLKPKARKEIPQMFFFVLVSIRSRKRIKKLVLSFSQKEKCKLLGSACDGDAGWMKVLEMTPEGDKFTYDLIDLVHHLIEYWKIYEYFTKFCLSKKFEF